MFPNSRVSSTFARYASISSFVRSVPRSALMRSGSNGTLEGSLTSLQISTHPPTTSPAPSSSISCMHDQLLLLHYSDQAFSIYRMHSVRSPILLEERRMFVPLKHAASKSTVCTLSVIMEFSPPMIPAMRLLSFRHRSSEPDHPFHVPDHPVLQIFSPAFARRTTISLPSIVSRSYACIG